MEKETTVTMRLTSDQYIRCKAAASANGMKWSAWIAEAVMTHAGLDTTQNRLARIEKALGIQEEPQPFYVAQIPQPPGGDDG